MKTKILPLIAAALLAGCSTTPHACHLLEFNHTPSPATQAALAATTAENSTNAIRQWFAAGNDGFVINTTNLVAATNAIRAALSDGGTELP